MERSIRIGALIFRRWTERFGLTRGQAARKLGICAHTLGSWGQAWRENRLRPEPRGRPAQRPQRSIRSAIIAEFDERGPGVGVPTLGSMFPDVARAELEELARRYRQLYRKKNSMQVYALRWEYPGAVWAMDYTEPPLPVDGIYPYLLVVRDLASGRQLWSQPAESENAETTIAALKALFLW
ncbi:MAG: hypothetical protein V3U28_11430, partial [Candidatus Acidoferrales bacterium]